MSGVLIYGFLVLVTIEGPQNCCLLGSVAARETQISTSRPRPLVFCFRINTIFYFFEVRAIAVVEFRDPRSAPSQVSLFFTVTIKPQSVHIFRWWKADGEQPGMMGTPDTVVRTSLVLGLGVKASQMLPLQAGLPQDLLRELIFTH